MQFEIIDQSLGESDAARLNRKLFARDQVFAVNVVGGAGCGKTALILETLRGLRRTTHVGVIAAHPTSHRDTERLAGLADCAVHVNTAEGECLTARHVRQALKPVDLRKLDLLLIENISSLIGTADHDLGEAKRVAIFSVAAGDDKPAKYAHVVKWADVVVLSKIDLLPSFPFDLASFRTDVRRINPAAAAFELSVVTGEGMDSWLAWLRWQSHKDSIEGSVVEMDADVHSPPKVRNLS